MFKNLTDVVNLNLTNSPTKKELSEIIKNLGLETVPFLLLYDNNSIYIYVTNEEIQA